MSDKLTLSIQISFACYLIVTTIIFLIVVYWRVHAKAGWPGWTVFVPIYNTYVDVKIAGKPGWWLVLLFLPIAQFVAIFLMCLSMAERFDKSAWFGLGLFLFPPVFLTALAFDDSQYVGDRV